MIDQLPSEMVLKILENLSQKEVLAMSLVNKQMYQYCSDPSLWQSFQVFYGCTEVLFKILSMPRFKRLKSLHITNNYLYNDDDENIEFTERELNQVFKLLLDIQIEEIIFANVDVKQVNTSLLIKVLKSTEYITIEQDAQFDKTQILSILQNIPSSKIKSFQAKMVNFTDINPKIINAAINNLEKFGTHYCEFSTEQVKVIFDEMSKETNLKFFAMNSNNKILENVSATTLASAVNNIESVFLNETISNNQMISIFEKMASETKIKNLFLSSSDNVPIIIENIPNFILSKAINNLEMLESPNFYLSESQLKRTLEQVSDKKSKIKSINVACTNLPDLEISCLKTLICKLEENKFRHEIEKKMSEVLLKMKENKKRKLEKSEELDCSFTQNNKKPRYD